MLDISRLNVQCEGKQILSDVSLHVDPGELHIILGPNGSGKSTFGRALLGDPVCRVSGEVSFLGKDLLSLSVADRVKRGLFLSFQSPPELDGVSVVEFLMASHVALSGKKASQFRFKRNLKALFSQLRLDEDMVDREVNKGFSGGERKKLEMVSLMIAQPQLAVLDEIDSGVDVDTVKIIGQSIHRYLENDTSRSMIIITHSERILKEVVPSFVHILCQGRIIKSGGREIIEKVHADGFDHFFLSDGGLRVIN